MNHKIYSIIVTYNGIEWIQRCLDSLINSSFRSTIIVIDNGSTDGTPEIIKKEYSEIKLISSKINLGFGRANNQGIRIALENGADFTFLLNQDAWVARDTLEKLVLSFKKFNDYGLLSPIHYDGSGKELDIYFRKFIKECALEIDLTRSSLQEVYNVKFVNAAAWMISRNCLEHVGGFDPDFPHYGEDEDYANRALYHGYKIGVVSDAFISHDRKKRILEGKTPEQIWKNRYHKYLIQLKNPAESFDENYKQIQLSIIKDIFNHLATANRHKLRKTLIIYFNVRKQKRRIREVLKITKIKRPTFLENN